MCRCGWVRCEQYMLGVDGLGVDNVCVGVDGLGVVTWT